MIQVAVYCRVSTDKEDQATSFMGQKSFFQAYIARHPDWELYEIYADEGITGTSTKKRAAFNRMIRDAYEGKFQLILTKEISRFSRNILDTIHYTRTLKERGVGVFFLSENLSTWNPEAELLLSIMGTLAQEESRKTSQRVKWGQTRRMEEGVVFGKSLLGFTVRDGNLMEEPEGAALVRRIFQNYTIEKKGTSEICRELEAEGHRTSTGNTRWYPSHIIKILKNEKYVGDLIQKKTITPNYLDHQKKINHGEEAQIIIPSHHEGIVSRTLWDATQKELDLRCRKRNSGSSMKYALSGKIHCAICGSVFIPRNKRLQSGRVVRRWCCAGAVRKGSGYCNIGRHLREEDGIQMVKEAVSALRLDWDNLLRQVAKIAEKAILEDKGCCRSVDRLQRELDKLEEKLASVMDAYFSREISREEMMLMKKRYHQQAAKLRDAKKQRKMCMESREIPQILTKWMDNEENWSVLSNHLLERITVFQDRHMELKLKHIPYSFYFEEETL